MTTTSKYVYGTMSGLGQLLKRKGTLRFTDIVEYARMENALMRDDESIRSFSVEPHQIHSLKVENYTILPNEFVGPLKFGMNTRRCFCLCMSNTGYSPKLFGRFKADICLEIDLVLLLQILADTLNHKKELSIVNRNVRYTDYFFDLNSASKEELVFVKRTFYEVEDEHRLAIFFPYDDKTLYRSNGIETIVFGGKTPHIEIGMKGGYGMKQVVKEARDIEGKVIFKRPPLEELPQYER